MDSVLRGLAITFFLDCIWFMLCFLYFYVYRRRRSSDTVPNPSNNCGCTAPATLPSSFLRVDAEQFPNVDIRVYLLFLRGGFLLFAALSAVGLAVAVPINWSARVPQDGSLVSPLDRASAQNIPEESARIWFLYIATWVYSLMAYCLVTRLRLAVIPSTKKKVCSRTFDPAQYTVMLRGLPKDLVDANILYEHFSRYFGSGSIVAAHIALDYSGILELVDRGNQFLWFPPQETKSKSDTHRDTHETVDFDDGHRGPSSGTGFGFVSFVSKAIARKVLENSSAVAPHFNWTAEAAPMPQDIIWQNLHVSSTTRIRRRILLNASLFLFSVTIVSPVLILNFLNPLLKNLKVALREDNYFKLLLTAYLPPFLLVAVNSLLLPLMIYYCVSIERHWRKSDADAAVLNGNVMYMILNSLVIPLLSVQSLSAVLQRMYRTQIQDWNVTFGTLVLSTSGSFALRYLINGCLLTSASQLLQLAQLVNYYWQRLWGESRNERQRVDEASAFDFGYQYAFSLSLLTLCLFCSVAVPLVLPWGCLAFAMKYTIDRYNLQHGILQVESDSGGVVVETVLGYTIFACSLLQFAMSGYFVSHGSQNLLFAGCVMFMLSAVTMGLLGFHNFYSRFGGAAVTGQSVDEFPLDGTSAKELVKAYVHPSHRDERFAY